MVRKFYITYVCLTAAALLAGVIGFTAASRNHVEMANIASASDVR